MGRKRIDGDSLKEYRPTVKRNFSVRIPRDLDKQLFNYVMDNNLNMSHVLVAMIKLYLNGDSVGLIPIESIKKGQTNQKSYNSQISGTILLAKCMIRKDEVNLNKLPVGKIIDDEFGGATLYLRHDAVVRTLNDLLKGN